LFDGFAVMDNVQRTRFEATASQYALYGIAQEQALNVAQVYLGVLEAEKVVTLSARNLEKHKEVYDQISDRVKQGLGSSADLSQIEGRMARAQVNVISAEHNLLDAKSRFVEIVGKDPVELKWPVSDAVMFPNSLENALSIARQEHPVVLSAYSDTQAAGEQYELSKSNYYPKLSLELDAVQNNNINGVEHSIEQLSAMLRMRYNLYSGGEDSANKLKAAYQEAQSKDIYALSIRQVMASTKLSWRAKEYLEKQIPFLQKHVDSAKDAERIYEEQFFLGKRSLLDLLDTSNELFEARKTYNSVEHAQLFAQYRVLANTGRLLASLRVEKPKQWRNNDE
ncbi:MAG: TolC family outer membrane protein, partial [Colwellia sp.]